MRDALSILDQALSFHDEEILTQDIQRITGSVTQELLEQYVGALADSDTKVGLNLLQNLLAEGKDAGRFVEDVILFSRDLLLFQNTQEQGRSVFKIAKFGEEFETLANRLADDFLYDTIRVFNETQQELRLSNHAEVYLEVATIKLSQQKVPVVAEVKQQQQPEMTQNVSPVSNDEVKRLQSELNSLKTTISDIQTNGTRPRKAPPKSPAGNFKADRATVFNVLAEATHGDLRSIKSVWTDILNVLDVGQKALLNNSEPVAASPTSLVVRFDYGILCERAQNDTMLHDTVNNYLDKVLQRRIRFVCVTTREWPEIRQDYIKQMNAAKQSSGELDEADEEKQEPKEEAVVSKAVEMFGDNFVEVLD